MGLLAKIKCARKYIKLINTLLDLGLDPNACGNASRVRSKLYQSSDKIVFGLRLRSGA